ncbi:hypothetical protein M1105_07380 [Limibaculum sp. FT325]|uniref:hypothetical protein n=1 Tax=Thermohalobaculum sediminis TaxID=2939436 RepID=UPI0020BE3E01|nr:hypothetical protein [Limibaculum sediminis]MCL5776807.1 hypothetical protein [Limibaculum sediminis]
MTRGGDKAGERAPGSARAERLAEALRRNLHLRKAQARARRASDAAAEPEAAAGERAADGTARGGED